MPTVDRPFCFPERQKQEVFVAASRDGFTAVRKTKCDPPPHKEGLGFSIELKAFPLDGRLVVLPPDTDDGNGRNGK